MADDFVKVILPMITFVLGGVLTIAIKAIEQRRDVVRSAVKEAVRLTKDWYVQIHTLALTPNDRNSASGAINTAVYDYVHNRLILPDFLLNLEILRSKREATGIVDALNAFLNEVTEVKPRATVPDPDDNPLSCKRLFEDLSMPEPLIAQGVLERLDQHVQRVTKESAKLLAA